jgi:hypothetical protein
MMGIDEQEHKYNTKTSGQNQQERGIMEQPVGRLRSDHAFMQPCILAYLILYYVS